MMEDVLRWARAVLATTPQRWTTLTDSLPAHLLARPPARGEWSAVECLQHLIDAEALFLSRTRAFLAGQDFPAFNPATDGTKVGADVSPGALAARFVALRAEGLDALEALAPSDLDRRARHAELGPVTLGELVHEWAAHDLMHTVQAERALMQPFIAGCGPWQVYFADHIVGQGQETGAP